MGTSGDQVSWSSAAVEKGLALDFWANEQSFRAVVLRGLPDLGLSKTSPVSSYLFLILCTWRWDKVSATSAVDLVFSLLIISTLVSGWILGMLSEAKLQLMWRSGVLGFFLYTPKNWLINYWSQVKLKSRIGCIIWQGDKTFVFAKIDSMGLTELWTLEYFLTVSFCTKTLFQKLLGLKWAISCKKID